MITYDVRRVTGYEFVKAVLDKYMYSYPEDDRSLTELYEELEELVCFSPSRPRYLKNGERAMEIAEQLAHAMLDWWDSNRGAEALILIPRTDSEGNTDFYWQGVYWDTNAREVYWNPAHSTPVNPSDYCARVIHDS